MHLPNETNFCNVSKITNCCDSSSSSSSSLHLQLQLINVFLCCRQTRTPHLPDLICRLLRGTLANLGATEQPALRKCSEMAIQNTRFLQQTAWKKPTARFLEQTAWKKPTTRFLELTAWKKPTAKVSVKLYMQIQRSKAPGATAWCRVFARIHKNSVSGNAIFLTFRLQSLLPPFLPPSAHRCRVSDPHCATLRVSVEHSGTTCFYISDSVKRLLRTSTVG